MKRKSLLIVVVVLLLVSACSSQESTTLETIATAKPEAEPLATTFAVGDIDKFNQNLSPIVKQLVEDYPDSYWWLLGDAGYGSRAEVRKNYSEITSVIPKGYIRMIYGDHDYGTQNPNKFTKENLVKTGAGEILSAQDTFMDTINNFGDLTVGFLPKEQTLQIATWKIVGINDICVETDTIENVDCDAQRFKDFEFFLKIPSQTKTCNIAMWHHPVFGVVKNGGNDEPGGEKYGTPLHEAALENGVDIILNGDHHHFLATKPIDINGELVADPNTPSARQFIVGTGGASYSLDLGTPRLPKEAIDSQIDGTVGVLKLELFTDYAQVTFISAKGPLYTTRVDC